MRYKKSLEEFVKECWNIHGDRYGYSKVEYKGTHNKICIICFKHREFWQTPHQHLRGQGCPICSVEDGTKKEKLTIEEFIDKSNVIHGNKYDYSISNYIGSKINLCIICPDHGEFWQTPNSHLKGRGCPKCVGNHNYSTEEWIKKARLIHGDKYDYSKVKYINNRIKVCIICKNHGEFWQKPISHLIQKHGCPHCKTSKLEDETVNMLKQNNIEFEKWKRFNWLRFKSGLIIDFYLPKYNIALECNGEQHYRAIKHFGGSKGLEIIKKRDKIKREKCLENGIKIFYVVDVKHSSKRIDNLTTFSLKGFIKYIKNGEKK